MKKMHKTVHPVGSQSDLKRLTSEVAALRVILERVDGTPEAGADGPPARASGPIVYLRNYARASVGDARQIFNAFVAGGLGSMLARYYFGHVVSVWVAGVLAALFSGTALWLWLLVRGLWRDRERAREAAGILGVRNIQFLFGLILLSTGVASHVFGGDQGPSGRSDDVLSITMSASGCIMAAYNYILGCRYARTVGRQFPEIRKTLQQVKNRPASPHRLNLQRD